MYKVSKLNNGLTVATSEMPHMSSVSLGLWVGVGGRYEPAKLNGVCHFIEHLLFKGTKRRSARQISQDIEGIGGYLNAFTSEEITCYHSKACHDRFGELLDVLTDMFLHSRFDPADIQKERDVIKEELAMYLDQPQHQVQEILNETLWPDQPLGRPLTGTEKTLDYLTRSRLVDYQRENYVTNRTLFTAAGRLNHQQVVKAISRVTARFPQGNSPAFVPVTDSQQKPTIRLFTKKTEQTQMALGIRTCSRHDPRRFALRLLNTMLGENMSSRLFQVVREDRGLAYSIYSSLNYFDDTGILTISAGLDVANLNKTLKLIRHELDQFTQEIPSIAEFRRARDYIIGQIDLGLESTDSQMMMLGEQLLGYGKIILPAEIKRHLSAVKPGEIRDVARAFFRPERINLALVSPLKSDRGLLKTLCG
ncbi:MAG: Peptidase domain protein [Pedosphaera sp.]|nr:Peptidase domain protein [Pedosphaera sp.]